MLVDDKEGVLTARLDHFPQVIFSSGDESEKGVAGDFAEVALDFYCIVLLVNK
jgi:hypothetical protein